MAKHVWTVLCQTVLTDQVTNAVSYIQAVEGFSFSQLPGPSPQFAVGSLWEREANEAELVTRIRVLAPNGDVISVVETKVGRFGAAKRMRSNFIIGGFTVSAEGVHLVVVEQRRGGEWTEEARVPLEVTQMDQERLRELLEKRAAALST